MLAKVRVAERKRKRDEEDAEMVTDPAPVMMGTPTSSTAPDSMIVVVESASLICSVHTALAPAIPHWTSTCSVSSAVAMIAPSETCVASSTSVTASHGTCTSFVCLVFSFWVLV